MIDPMPGPTRANSLFLLLLTLAFPCLAAPASRADNAPPLLSPAPLLFEAPKTHPAPGFDEPGVRALFFDAVPFKGKPTRAFAWVGLPEKIEPGKKVPGMVLVHGGGGTAFADWVRLWTGRGYAAIAMDTCGQVPRGTYGNWERHEHGGPPGWGDFDNVDAPPADQWTYHAASSVILAHSLLRAMPEVDADRVGLTGISWGGYLTCIVAGIDDRFRFAAPVYGCGFLGDNSAWLPNFKQLGPDRAKRWLAMWDPSVYLPRAKMPMLWVTGTNDFAYPLDSLQKSYRLPPGPRTLAITVRMPHGHGGAGENPPEIHAFAESILNGGPPLAKVREQSIADSERGGIVLASFEVKLPLKKAELVFTKDAGEWTQREWSTLPATVEAGNNVTATLPQGVTVYYLNVLDERGSVVSTEHVEAGAVNASPERR